MNQEHQMPTVIKGPLADALARADAATDPPCAMQFDTPRYRRLIRFAAELQRMAGDQPFCLQGRVVQDVMQTNWQDAHMTLGGLVALEILAIAERGGAGKATRYRFIGATAPGETTK